ncbi:hypothetical protein J2Z31_001723 [Sinorhizobium kostiense]|uniref:Uncharacterized protein n=1 Tax=Sinorhizobium kostiense TaxID=76747 RepID=A0ABS4QX63_9HYPH|nr:hypothetical protein [Sinorhizobium kostiense]MBP2235231.1 hypothetical protein [Sinorhizobium kostiense]
MTAAELNELFGAIIAPTAEVSIPDAWLPAVHDALRAIEELPTDIRAFAIVTGVIESDGQLRIKITAAPEYMPEDGMQRIAEIVANAQAAVKRSVH